MYITSKYDIGKVVKFDSAKTGLLYGMIVGIEIDRDKTIYYNIEDGHEVHNVSEEVIECEMMEMKFDN